jgi:hypothetical protein
MSIPKAWLWTLGSGIILLSGAAWLHSILNGLSHTSPQITVVEAIEEVLSANPGTTATNADLERDRNTLIWKIVLNNDVTVSIDANTKRIVKSEQAWSLRKVPILAELVQNGPLASF